MKYALPLLVLLFLSVFALPTAHAETSIQTRYPTLFGVSYNSFMNAWLGTFQDVVLGYTYYLKLNTVTGSRTAYWGIRVYVIHWDYGNTSVITEISNGIGGIPVAVVSRSTNGEGLQSATWNCPETALARNDTIVVTYFYRFFIGASLWTQWLVDEVYGSFSSDFIMENNGYATLLASTWNVTYYTYRYYPISSKTELRLYINNATYSTRVGNMQFDDGVSAEVESEFPVGLGAGALLLGFVAVIAFSIKKRR